MMEHQSIHAIRIHMVVIALLLLACLSLPGILMSAQATTVNTESEEDVMTEDINSDKDEATTSENDLPEWTTGIECTVCHVDQVYSADVMFDEDESDDVEDDKVIDTSKTSDSADETNTSSDDDTESNAVIDIDEVDDEDLAIEGEPLMALHAGIDCQYCHPDSDDMDYAHWRVTVDSTMPTSLHYTKVDSEVCIVCHETDYTPEATEDIDALTDSNGLTINPHDLPDAEGTHSSVVCTDCHSMHEIANTEELAYDRCISCHHMEVWGCNCHNV